MRRWLALPVVTLAVLAARSVGAEDPKTYTIPARETWKVGDVVSKKSTEKKIKKQTVKGPDGTVVNESATEETEAYEGTMKVLEVNAEGEFTKALGGQALTLDPKNGVLSRPGLLARLGLG